MHRWLSPFHETHLTSVAGGYWLAGWLAGGSREGKQKERFLKSRKLRHSLDCTERFDLQMPHTAPLDIRREGGNASVFGHQRKGEMPAISYRKEPNLKTRSGTFKAEQCSLSFTSQEPGVNSGGSRFHRSDLHFISPCFKVVFLGFSE